MLKLVTKRQPDALEQRVLNSKALMRNENMMQCPRCNSRTEVKEVTGSYVRNGKKQQGTVIHKGICSNCYRLGSVVPMTAVPYLLLSGPT